VHVDLGASDDTERSMLLAEIEGGDDQSRLAYRDGERYSAKFARAKTVSEAHAKDAMEIPEAENFHLEITSRGILDNLKLLPAELEAPGPHDISVRVYATGLNFRDVLNALGQYPGDAGKFGLECSGVVTAVGAEVSRFKVGDRVMANANGSFRRIITFREDYAVHLPEGMNWEDAVTVPGPFLTAWYGLVRKGGIKSGDKVLIHAGAGGVGMAAVQIALSQGCEVFATASLPKQQFLRDMGVHHVFNSRTLDFADEVMKVTDGKGVDLLLNSLAGEFIAKSFSIMAENGRFIEMGKMNIWTPEQVKEFNASLDYAAFDLAADGAEDPSLIATMFDELLAEFEAGRLSPLNKTVFPLERTVDAFRFMAQAKHIGKIVVSQSETVRRERIANEGIGRTDGTYVITGGLGALGLIFARWLSENGAGNLALFGRSKPKPAAEKVIAELKEAGTNVQVFAADASDLDSLGAVFQQIREEMPPVRGILHAAGILDDGMMISQDWSRFENVLNAKVYGGWNLHELSRGMDLDFFVLFSSVAALFGNRGQCNYASANAFLDSLASHRRAEGLPALTVNWGPWGEAGMATDAKKAALIAKQGFYNIRTEDGLEVLRRALDAGMGQVGVVELNLKNFLDNLPPSALAGYFEPLVARRAAVQSKDSASSAPAVVVEFYGELKGAGEGADRIAIMTGLVKESVASVLNFKSLDDIDGDRAFRELGFDSLTNAEFINLLDKTLQVGLSQSIYLEYPTVNQLSAHLVDMPAILDKVEAAEAAEHAVGDGGGDTAKTSTASGKTSGNGAPAKTTEPKPAQRNGKQEPVRQGAEAAAVADDLSYHSPVKGHTEGDLAADDPTSTTDRYMQESLSKSSKDNGGENGSGKKGWFQRFLDALTDIES
jgi:NADPH:quinone reductase-like Zn-dependent oxidoreductase/acyl carrier protein